MHPRVREQSQAGVPDDGLEELANVLGTVDTGTAQQVLDEVLIQPTFIARPTEARRKTVKAKPRSIAADLETFDEQLLTDKERRQIKFTEQGETIAAKYANPSIVERELEQMLNAQVRARVNGTEHPTEPVDRSGWRPWRRRPTPHTRDTRHCSVPRGFVEYFEQATPITVIEDINLGSRPASRSGERTVGDLREIPWVFS